MSLVRSHPDSKRPDTFSDSFTVSAPWTTRLQAKPWFVTCTEMPTHVPIVLSDREACRAVGPSKLHASQGNVYVQRRNIPRAWQSGLSTHDEILSSCLYTIAA
jgi:hypothetical protein